MAKITIVAATSLFILCTGGHVRHFLFSWVESDPLPFPTDYKYVVVLGARIYPNKLRPISSQLSPTLLSRISYGIELAYKNPESFLIVTGNGASEIPEAQLMEKYALSLGFPKDRIIVEDKSMNTKEHPLYLESILKNQKFVIVTSAYHMNRALRNFRNHELEGYPAPTDYASSGRLGLGSFILRGENLALVDRWASEMYSKIWTEGRLLFR